MKNQNFYSDFIQQWSAERQKSRKRHLYSVPAAFLGFQFLWMIWQLRTSSAEELQHGYTMLFYQLPMLNAILLPVMAAVIANRLCDMELKGDTLKLLYTLQKRTVFYDCKYLVGLKYVLAFSLGQCVLILLGGRLCRISEALNPIQLAQSAAVVFAVTAVLLCLQQFLSLLSRNQLLPLSVGLAGAFLGLFSMFFPPEFSRFILWGYYAAFPTVGMNWDPSTRYIEYYSIVFPTEKFALFICFLLLAYFISRSIITKKEV